MRKAILSIMLFVCFMAQAQTRGSFLSLTMPCKHLHGLTERVYGIYLPGSYFTDSLRRYPVLYLMHGGGDSHIQYEKSNHLSRLADSLISNGAIQDMIIVCPEGNKNHMMYFNAENGKYGAPDYRYEDYFFLDLIPYIESHFRCRTDKNGRAIAGFSMGGGAATVYGVHHPELFSMVYDISGYLRPLPLPWLKGDKSAQWRQGVIGDNNPINTVSKGSEEQVRLWKKVNWKIAVGDMDFTLDSNMDLMKAFHEKGIHPAMFVKSGNHNMEWVSKILPDVFRMADRSFK